MVTRFLFLLFVLFFLVQPSFADSWDDFSNLDRIWDGQKTITNQEFEKVIDKLEEKTEQKEVKQKKKKRKKMLGGGNSLHSELNPDNEIQQQEILVDKNEINLINIPVDVSLDGIVLEKGYYNILSERDKDSNKVYVSFYQSQFFKGKIEVIETESDFGEEGLNFAKIIPYNEDFVKLIFGSIEFNAYKYLPYVK